MCGCRLSEPQPTTPVGYYRHVATVLNAPEKAGRPRSRLLCLCFRISGVGQQGLHDIDQELVMFLKSSGTQADLES